MTEFFTRELLINLIFVFLITGSWDIVLRFMSQGYVKFLGIENMKWVKVLKDYFDKHTLLSAFLIAALVGAIAYICIMYTYSVINLDTTTTYGKIIAISIVFLISGLLGFPMRYSGLFPILEKHYYEPLGLTYSFITDSMSGVIVSITLFIIQELLKKY